MQSLQWLELGTRGVLGDVVFSALACGIFRIVFRFGLRIAGGGSAVLGGCKRGKNEGSDKNERKDNQQTWQNAKLRYLALHGSLPIPGLPGTAARFRTERDSTTAAAEDKGNCIRFR